jgi:ATP-binding cassette, subfamily B, bacterial
VHEPAILLLDDPTAAIDARTEREIFTALDNAMRGRTTLIVAHRVSTLRRADLIVVLEQGRIVQRGTHAELLRQPGAYRRVAALQLVDARELDQPPESSP